MPKPAFIGSTPGLIFKHLNPQCTFSVIFLNRCYDIEVPDIKVPDIESLDIEVPATTLRSW